MTKLEIPSLNEGEVYAGFIGTIDGVGHHIVLLPGDNDDSDWKTQMAWAESIGGDLPTRVEQALLKENVPDQFKRDWYWSNQTHASNADCAWCQYFNLGRQNYFRKVIKLRARAVRRLPI